MLHKARYKRRIKHIIGPCMNGNDKDNIWTRESLSATGIRGAHS